MCVKDRKFYDAKCVSKFFSQVIIQILNFTCNKSYKILNALTLEKYLVLFF